MTNPVLVEVTRGPLVESLHRGALAVASASGEVELAVGDVDRPVYPRSAIKALQAIPLVETGAADRWRFEPADLALAIASHSGTEAHVDRAASMLARAGLGEDVLGCGAHAPMGAAAAAAFYRAGRPASQLHNNCSGKHAGMVATCAHCGDAVEGYLDPSHPHQRRIRSVLEEFTGSTLGDDVLGVDGCSAPNWAIPLGRLAGAFARFGAGAGAASRRAGAVRRILEAAWAAPEMVAGPGRLDTTMMTELRGEVFVKTGAEGVYCGTVPRRGLGFAIKIDDGAGRASEAVVGQLVARLVPAGERFARPTPLSNWKGVEVGFVRPSEALVRALGAFG